MTIILRRTDRRSLKLSVDESGADALRRAMAAALAGGTGDFDVIVDDHVLDKARGLVVCDVTRAEGPDGSLMYSDDRTKLRLHLHPEVLEFGVDCLEAAPVRDGFEAAEFCRWTTAHRRDADEVFWEWISNASGDDSAAIG